MHGSCLNSVEGRGTVTSADLGMAIEPGSLRTAESFVALSLKTTDTVTVRRVIFSHVINPPSWKRLQGKKAYAKINLNSDYIKSRFGSSGVDTLNRAPSD